jgi:hypothetical protein
VKDRTHKRKYHETLFVADERKMKSLQLFDPCFLVEGRDAGHSFLVEPGQLLCELAVRVFCVLGLSPRRIGLDRDRIG